MSKKLTSPELTVVHESGVAVVESQEQEKARLTAEIADLDQQWETVRGQAVPSPHFPGMDYAPSKRRLTLEIEISERRIRLCEIAHEEAQAEAERLRAEAEATAPVRATEREQMAERIRALEIELAQLRNEYRMDNRGFMQAEAIRDAERTASRTAGEVEYWQGHLSKRRKELADAEQQEAIKRHNRAESIAQQQSLAG